VLIAVGVAFAFSGVMSATFNPRLMSTMGVPFAFGGLIGGLLVELVAQASWGQSIGKRLVGIRVMRLDGSEIELWRLILLRNVVLHVVGQLCGLIGLIDALWIFGDQQRCLHDYLADSIVVNVEGRP
jgi:uncharacterized RDD family membrane protein YckC